MKNRKLGTGLFQFAIWIIIIVLIVIRIISNNFAWVWIINYIGMVIALLNLLISKCYKLKDCSHSKYKPFKGFTIFTTIIICLFTIPIYELQSTIYSLCVNDVITLLALLFSLPQGTWDFILDLIVKKLKK